jgi:hypothetical protein
LTPPDRPFDADPPHASPAAAGDTRRDDCSQRHCPHPDDPGNGTDIKTTAYPRTPPGSRFPQPDHRAPGRSPQGRLRRRRWRPGYARSLTCPAARHGDSSYQETGDASHARPPSRQNPAKPPLTRPRSFRDDRPHITIYGRIARRLVRRCGGRKRAARAGTGGGRPGGGLRLCGGLVAGSEPRRVRRVEVSVRLLSSGTRDCVEPGQGHRSRVD